MTTKDVDDFFMAETVPEPPPEVSSPAPVQEAPKTGRKNSGSVVPDLRLESGLPADVSAEKALLGSIMLDNDALKTISIAIEPTDFSLESHSRICLRMKDLFEVGKPIDIVTLANLLAKNKEVDSVGGVAYLASLTEGLPRRPVINEYIRLVKDKSLLRRLMVMNSRIIARAADQSESSCDLLDDFMSQLAVLKDESRVLRRRDAAGPFFVGYNTFVGGAPEVIEWTVEGIIQRVGNGLILGDSGTSKSLLVFDLALHMVAGASWFHHSIPERLKVGLVAREDAPGLSQSRLKRLIEGSELIQMFTTGLDLETCLYVNTRSQRETWSLQKESDIQEIVEATKERGINFLFFDVFRALWEGNENDNQETAKVLAAAKRIEREANCQVCIVHHLSKSDRGTVFDRARGGGINGWKEWGIGITVENQDAEPRDQVRKLHFHTKASVACGPICYRIDGYESKVELVEVDAPTQQYNFKQSKKGKKEPTIQSQMPYSED